MQNLAHDFYRSAQRGRLKEMAGHPFWHAHAAVAGWVPGEVSGVHADGRIKLVVPCHLGIVEAAAGRDFIDPDVGIFINDGSIGVIDPSVDAGFVIRIFEENLERSDGSGVGRAAG